MANCDSKPDLAQINQFLMKIGELKHLDRAGWVLRNIEKVLILFQCLCDVWFNFV